MIWPHDNTHTPMPQATQASRWQRPRSPKVDGLNLAVMEISWQLVLYGLAGSAGGLLALRTGIPAAPLAGALIGAALVSMSGRLETARWPIGTRTLLEIAIGTVIGTALTTDAVSELKILWRPALLITLSLVLTGLVVGLWTSRLLGINPVVSLLGAAPGGISGMSLVGAEFGVGAAVAVLHAVRLITVLLVLPLVVRWILPGGGTPPPA
jgi:membrane AbrB-like protein